MRRLLHFVLSCLCHLGRFVHVLAICKFVGVAVTTAPLYNLVIQTPLRHVGAGSGIIMRRVNLF